MVCTMDEFTLKKETFTLRELSSLSNIHESTILSWGYDKNLIFSCNVYDARLELGYFANEYDLVKAKSIHFKNRNKVLDLCKNVISGLRTNNQTIANQFVCKDWTHIHWYGKGAPRITSKDIFVRNENLIGFLQEEVKIAEKFKYKHKKKTGPKTNKKEKVKDHFKEKIRNGDLT